MGDELWQRTGVEMASMIATGEVSSREVVDAHLDRIHEVNGWLNAAVLVLADEARVAADAADRALADGEEVGRLHGVPFTVKDGLDLAGQPTTYGVEAFADGIAALDDPTIGRLRTAGAIPIAKTNLPAMGMRIATDNSLFGLTRNPWHPERTAGGSSGGEASAIAAGMAPMGMGTDLGGSVLNPAYCCGIAATKTSLGRLPVSGSSPNAADPMVARQLMSVAGPMARSVADLEAMLRITIGRHRRDPRTVNVPYDGAPAARRVAIPTDLPGGPVHPDAHRAAQRAADAMADAGWEVVDALPPEIERCYEVWGHLLGHDFPATLTGLDNVISDADSHLMRASMDFWPASGMTPQIAHTERFRLARAWAEFLAEYPVVVLPTWYQAPFDHHADLADDRLVLRALFDGVFTPIVPANLLGLPATQIPVGLGSDGTPLGVQCMADRHREDLTLVAAAIVEQAFPPLTPIQPATG